MAREFSASTVIDRPVDEVFAVKAAIKDAPAFARRIKAALEAS